MEETQSNHHKPGIEQRVNHALEHTGHLLPDQAPIRVFIHHNTLHAFQHLHFHDAVLMGRDVYGAEPYVSEAHFREKMASGRITHDDLEAALRDQLAEGESVPLVGELLDLHGLRTLLLRHPVGKETAASLRWKIHEQGLLKRLRDDVPAEARTRFLVDTERWLRLALEAGTAEAAVQTGRLITGEKTEAAIAEALSREHAAAPTAASLRANLGDNSDAFCVSALWTACREAATGYVSPTPRISRGTRQHRDVLLDRTGQDIYDLVFPILIRLCAAYFDDGLAQHTLPQRELGFYRAVRALVGHGSTPVSRWLRRVKDQFLAQEKRNATAMDVVLEVLSDLGVAEGEAEVYIEHLLLTLPGWAGMMSRLERNPDDRPHGSPPASLLDFLAVRLVYEREALRKLLVRDPGTSKLSSLPREALSCEAESGDHEAPFRLFQLMQLAGVPVPRLRALSKQEAHDVLRALDSFDEFWRRRVFLEAFERHHRCQILDAIAAHRKTIEPNASLVRPRFQLISCFDEREESFRRQLEEVAPDCQTFGAPGFFGAAMRFRAMDEHGSVPLAPVVIKPTHEIEERPRYSDVDLHEARTQRRRLFARMNNQLHRGSRSLWRGTILNAALGLLAALPMLTRILSPRSAGRVRRWTSERLLPSPRTELTIHHETASEVEAEPGIGKQRGFKKDERVARVATVLENLGFTKVFSKIVIVVGHGASTMNNPHKSAYDCGACGGRQGGPNARVFCHMANEPDVRRALAERGIHIPDDTWFVGGQHDTCNDQVTMLDTDRIPESHRAVFTEAMQAVHEGRARTAQERCRRLFSAPEDPTPAAALRHVEGRSEHLAEPRPEFGHATNAIAIIGRRTLTRGLFLDRRAFLLSYDPTIDSTGAILERTLAAATPVGAGINLEYYFCHVDNVHYGAGSKLPHNITGLIGVMSGHASDLRTGLPRQMIEIHEALRLLVIVEATPERLLDIASRQAEVRELVVNRWIQLVSLHPDTGAMQVFTDRGFVPYEPRAVTLPRAPTSRDFYRGHHDFLPPAQIGASKPRAA